MKVVRVVIFGERHNGVEELLKILGTFTEIKVFNQSLTRSTHFDLLPPEGSQEQHILGANTEWAEDLAKELIELGISAVVAPEWKS
ncbi:hypothetical protein LCGC14_1954330 [marine sediment metagenome]|uniref:Uncharacterized protein n=1 Tax=marine sediment metagenome TaxID=412755 RepID=A0A0F9IDL0_9ZZZZ